MRLRRRHVVSLAAGAAAAAAVVAIWNWTPLVPDRVAALLSDNLLREHGYRITLDAVRSSWSGEVLFVHPRVQALADTSATVLRADALRVRIRRPWSALHGRVYFARLRLERPRVEFAAVTPAPSASGAAPPGGGYPRVTVDALELVDASLRDAQGALLAEHIDVRARFQSRPNSVRADLQHASGFLVRDSLRVEDCGGQFVWRDDTLHVKSARLHLATTQLEGEGIVLPSRHAGRITSTLAPLDLHEIAPLLPPAARRGGRLRGAARLEWIGAGVEVSGRVTGAVDSLRLQDVEFDAAVDPRRWNVRRLAGRVNEQQIDGRGTGERQGPGLHGQLRMEAVDLARLIPAAWAPPQLARLPAHTFTGTVRLQRATGDTLQIDVDLVQSRIGALPLDRVTGTVLVAGGGVRVPRADVASPWGNLEVQGHARPESLDAEFDLVTTQAEKLLALAGQAGVAGDVALHGRLSGAPRALAYEVEGSSAELRVGAATLWSSDVAGWGRLRGMAPEGDLDLRADSLRVRGHLLRGLTADVGFAGRRLTVRRAQAAAGDTLLAAAGSIEMLSSDWSGTRRPSTKLRLETALLRFGDTELRVEDPATIWWTPAAVRVDSLQVASRGGRLGLDGTLDHAARRIDARARLDDFDLNFVRRFLPSRHEYSGIASGWLTAAGELARTALAGQLVVHGGTWNGLAIDSLSVALRTRDERTELYDLRLVTPRGSLSGALQVGAMLRFERWLVPGAPRALAAQWEQAELGGAVDFRDLDLAALWMARAPGRKPPAWGARLSAQLQLGGTVAAPRFESQGTATAAHAATVAIESVRFDAVWGDDLLQVRSMDIGVDGQTVHADADIPLGLHVPQGVVVHRDRPLRAEIIVPHTSFAVTERFLPIFEPPPVEIPRGEVEGDLRIAGTLDNPELHGGFGVVRASFALRDMEEVYRDVYATGEFVGSTLFIRNLRGRTGEKGTVEGDGRLEFTHLRLADYTWNLQLERVPVRSIPDITAIVNSKNLKIRAARIGEALVPAVSGDVDVQAADIRQEFVPSGTEAQPLVDTDVPEWLADVNVTADKGNVWIHNSVVDAELEGNLHFVRRRESEVQGLVRVKRGTYSYLIHRFEITRGELDFSRTGAFFDPELSIEAQRGRPGGRTYVTMSGRASAPQLAFRADRAETSSDQIQQDLLAVVGPQSQAAQTAIADFAEQTLHDLALLSDVSIDPAEGDKAATTTNQSINTSFRYNVSAAREISNRVFLIYTQGVNSDLAQRVAVEIDINRWLLLETRYERRSVTEAGIDQPQNAYELNFKYRYEY